MGSSARTDFWASIADGHPQHGCGGLPSNSSCQRDTFGTWGVHMQEQLGRAARQGKQDTRSAAWPLHAAPKYHPPTLGPSYNPGRQSRFQCVPVSAQRHKSPQTPGSLQPTHIYFPASCYTSCGSDTGAESADSQVARFRVRFALPPLFNLAQTGASN